jgi:hypothetical protein
MSAIFLRAMKKLSFPKGFLRNYGGDTPIPAQ